MFENKTKQTQEKSLLIVDDEEVILETYKRRLARVGYRVFIINSGVKAIEFLKKNVVDCIIMDYYMPNMDGLKTVEIMEQEIRELPPIIMNTANYTPDISSKFMENENAYYFISKTEDIEILDMKIQKAITSHSFSYKKQYNKVLEHNMVSEIDIETFKVIQVNKKFCEIYKCVAEDIIGKKCTLIDKNVLLSYIKKRGFYHTILEVKNCKDEKIYVDTSVTIISNRSGEAVKFLFISTDVTKREEVLQELTRINKSLSEQIKIEVEKGIKKDREKFVMGKSAMAGEVLSMLAHQARHPLGGIGAVVTELLCSLNDGSLSSEKLEAKLLFIEKMTKKTSEIMHNFLNAFMLDKQKNKVMLKNIIKDSLNMLEKMLENRSIKVILDIKKLEKIEVFTSEMLDVFLNIIKNSIDAISDKSIDKGIIDIQIFEDNLFQVITIEDNAEGIENYVMEKIFELYFTTKEKSGTGIGLYMSKVIIEDHHSGEIKVENTNLGAKFTIKIPKVNNKK